MDTAYIIIQRIPLILVVLALLWHVLLLWSILWLVWLVWHFVLLRGLHGILVLLLQRRLRIFRLHGIVDRIRVNASMRACMLALMSLVRCAHAFTPHTHAKVDLLRLVVRILLLLLGILILQTFVCRRSICQYSSSKHALKI